MKICLLLFFTFVTKVIWCDTESKMKILGSITATGTMKNFAKDTSKTVKLATEIKNMLNGMCTNSKHQHSYEKIDIKVQNISTDMELINEKLDKIENVVSYIKDIKVIKEKLDKLQNVVSNITDMEMIKEKLDKIQNVVSNIKANPHEEIGWTVIQKRYDGSVEFHRNWKDYELGFGYKDGEFWLGNKKIAQLTSGGNHELRIDVEDWNGNKRYALYRIFSISDASTKYQLTIGKYSGNAGDGMSQFNGMKFSTYDQDNDKYVYNCADHVYFKGGWWFNNCWNSNNAAFLNGHYTHRNNTSQGIIYKLLKKTSLKKSTMKIRRL